MTKKLNSRKDKLSFLKDLSAGKAKVEDICPLIVEFWTKYPGDENWTNEASKKQITNEEMEDRKARVSVNTRLLFITEQSK